MFSKIILQREALKALVNVSIEIDPWNRCECLFSLSPLMHIFRTFSLSSVLSATQSHFFFTYEL